MRSTELNSLLFLISVHPWVNCSVSPSGKHNASISSSVAIPRHSNAQIVNYLHINHSSTRCTLHMSVTAQERCLPQWSPAFISTGKCSMWMVKSHHSPQHEQHLQGCAGRVLSLSPWLLIYPNQKCSSPGAQKTSFSRVRILLRFWFLPEGTQPVLANWHFSDRSLGQVLHISA